MVGDDIDTDIGGAQRAGLKGVLVKTGKYLPHVASQSKITPYQTIESFNHIVEIL